MTAIFLGSDHAGIELKRELCTDLRACDHQVKDLGCHEGESVDYPDYAQSVGEAVLADPGSLGVLICGTGIGISIAANKLPGIRAALCHSTFDAQMARNHNNANIICLGARTTDSQLAKAMVHTFLDSTFEGGRHQRRVDKISQLESRPAQQA